MMPHLATSYSLRECTHLHNGFVNKRSFKQPDVVPCLKIIDIHMYMHATLVIRTNSKAKLEFQHLLILLRHYIRSYVCILTCRSAAAGST